MDKKNHLSVEIAPINDKVLHKKIYRICIDGYVFWRDTYSHAVARVIEILARDEFD